MLKDGSLIMIVSLFLAGSLGESDMVMLSGFMLLYFQREMDKRDKK